MQNKLKAYAKNNLTRTRIAVTTRDATMIRIGDIECINFSANDYLGIANCHQVRQAFIKGINEYGFGSVSSALVSGYYKVQQQLEEQFAEFLQRPRALYIGSGYLANIGVLTALANRDSVIISDKLSHASTLDGITLSRAKHYRFTHNNFISLEQRLRFVRNSVCNKKILVTSDGVFGMSGELCDLMSLIKVSRRYHALLVIDDAHGIGVLGQHGRGITEYYQLSPETVPCLVTPLSKAFAGEGAMVTGSADLIEAILQFARSYRCTTAPPPALAMALLTSLKIIQQQTWRRDKLKHLIKFFNIAAKARNLPLISDAITPIKSFLVGDNRIAATFHSHLAALGFYTACIRPPSIPENSARLRLSLTCHHDEKDILQLLDHLARLYATYKE